MFIKQIGKHVKEGMEVVVQLFGIEYSGKVIHTDFHNPQDAGMILENENGERHLVPVNKNSAVSFVMEAEDEGEDDDGGGKIEYEDMGIEELKRLAENRKIPYRKSVKKRGLINTLKYYDENPEEIETTKASPLKKRKKKTTKRKSRH
jgi:hypothetical protein